MLRGGGATAADGSSSSSSNAHVVRPQPQLLLDYRCHAKGGAIGGNFPPAVGRCLARFANMSIQELQDSLGLVTSRSAAMLQRRASDLLAKGFEWTLQQGAPTNPAAWRYMWPPPCCKLAPDGSLFGFRCASDAEWRPSTDLPLGNPVTGGEWDKARDDPGSYNGDTLYEMAKWW